MPRTILNLITNYKSGKSIAKQVGPAKPEEPLKSKRYERKTSPKYAESWTIRGKKKLTTPEGNSVDVRKEMMKDAGKGVKIGRRRRDDKK
ncbi:hypothetical protein [uncultured Imperialibacter sp.]|uniref:hypothetical protein n=1 Tax=uncultured Imperialibacter sp. TaxID=1672639 RepID=UPI0030D94153|tara:strand:- start:200 stop:469 length:270 start_codon:yes stop_codon:yes gene_type:complete